MILTATSTLSGHSAFDVFTITFSDPCKDQILYPPEFSDLTATSYLYESDKYFFTEAFPDIPNCSDITYELIDAGQGHTLSVEEFEIVTSDIIPYVRVSARYKTTAENSPYQLVIRATQGSYASIDSEPMFLTVLDPCINT